MTELNKGFNMDEYNAFKVMVLEDPKNADRDKTAVAHWVQGEEARVVVGDKEVTIGADDGLNMMEMVLASFAACDAAMVSLHASFMGLKVERVTVEVNGHFNVARYIGIEDGPGPGYDQFSLTIHVEAPDATPEQIAHLKHICETASPVGETLARAIPVRLEVKNTAKEV